MEDPDPLLQADIELPRFVFAVILIFISGLISGSEVAFFTTSLRDLDSGVSEKNNKNSEKLRKLLENPQLLLAALLTLNTFTNIGIVVVTDPLFHKFSSIYNYYERLFLQVGLLSFIILIFGELVPKIFARRSHYRLALAVAPFFYYIIQIGKPLFKPLLWTSKIVGTGYLRRSPRLSKTELSDAIEITGVSRQQTEESRILKGIINFGDKEVSSIMTPRVKVVGPDLKLNFEELLAYIRTHGFSRMPVFDGSPDSIAGILYIKDVIPYLKQGNEFNWSGLLKPPFFIPENMTARRLLQEFQNRNMHIALVVDEYGGLSGLVTLEDIIEEVVGEIEDEHDEVAGQGQKLSDNLFIFDGSVMISDFLKTCNLPDNFFDGRESHCDSLAGIIIELAERIPSPNEEINFKELIFHILKSDERRIWKVKVKILNT